MSMVWNGMGWRCRTLRPLNYADWMGLTFLYQPLVGSTAFSLYLTLSVQVPLHRAGVSDLQHHSYLLKLCSVSAEQLLEARHLLEGVGLLNTYEIKDPNLGHFYEYELIPPLAPSKFFQSDVLSMALYQWMGKEKFIATKHLLLGEPDNERGESFQSRNITKSFQEVFHSMSPIDLAKMAEWENEVAVPDLKTDERYLEGKKPEWLEEKDDFSFLKMRLSGLVEEDVWTDELLDQLREIRFLYQLDDWDLLKALQNPYVTRMGKIDLERLRSYVKSEYRYRFGSSPVVGKRAEPAQQPPVEKERATGKRDEEESLTEEEKHFRQLAQISPLELLSFYQKGGRVPKSDVELVETLIRHYGLPPGVINVLIEYVLLKYNYKLPRNLVEKIAGHWKRLGIETVEQALEQARKETWEPKKKRMELKATYPAKSQLGKVAKLPQTLAKQLSQESSKQPEEKKEDWQQKQEQLLAKLRLMNERFTANRKEKKNAP